MKTLLVSLIFLPVAAVVLLLPLVRLIVPVWPEPIEERLDPDGRPLLTLAASTDADPSVRSRPLSAAALDRLGGPITLGYVVALRDGEGRTSKPPDEPLWWPEVEQPGCDLGLTVERSLMWWPCAEFERVHHPNRMTTVSRFRVAVDRLLTTGNRHAIDISTR